MKKHFSIALYMAAAICIAGCAKTIIPGPNEANKREFEAWMEINHPNCQPSGLGIYILDETAGSGAEVTEEGLAFLDYRITDLEGNITSYTDEEAARQLGEYDRRSYYGPQFLTTYKTTIVAGLADALVGMKVGGSMDVIVPSWLMTSRSFDSAQEYLDYHDENNSTTFESTRYQFKVVDFTEDMDKWQIDSIGRFFKNTETMIYGQPASVVFNGMDAAKDTVTTNGFYYKQISAPTEGAEAFSKDTTIYINYTGKLLNGKVFDTTIERVARENYLYSESKSYKPVKIKWAEEYSDITMGSNSSSVIPGFALTLWQMKAMEKGVGVFYSNLGYASSGSGTSIPGYAPLIFEIEIVAKPE